MSSDIELDDIELERQINDWAADAAERIPPWNPERLADHRTPRRTATRVLAIAASIAVLVGGAGWLAASRDNQTVMTGGGGGPVLYERVEFRITRADITCPGEALPGNTVSTEPIVFEAWGDTDGGVWKNVVTYPDGRTRQVVAVGSPWYPTKLYVSGTERALAVGCADSLIGVRVAEPGQSGFFSLNPLAPIPDIGLPFPAVIRYDTLSERQPDAVADSRHRPCTLWREDGAGIEDGFVVTQRTDWCVDESTGVVLEKTFDNTLETIGSAATTLTLVDNEARIPPPDFFSADGMQRVHEAEYPNGIPTPVEGTTSGVGSASNDPNTPPLPSTSPPDPIQPASGAPATIADVSARMFRIVAFAENDVAGPVIDPARTSLAFNTDGTITGNIDCHLIDGGYHVDRDGFLAVGSAPVTANTCGSDADQLAGSLVSLFNGGASIQVRGDLLFVRVASAEMVLRVDPAALPANVTATS